MMPKKKQPQPVDIKLHLDSLQVLPKGAIDIDRRLRLVVREAMATNIGDWAVEQVQKQIKRYHLDARGGHSALAESISFEFHVTQENAKRMQMDVRVFSRTGPHNTQAKVASIETGRSPGKPMPPVDSDMLEWVHDVMAVSIRREQRKRRQKQVAKYKERLAAATKAGSKRPKKLPRRPPTFSAGGETLSEEQVAFVVARKIGEEGIPAKPIFGGAYLQIDRGITKRFRDALKEI